MSTVWPWVSRDDCLTPAPPDQQGPPKLLVRHVTTRYPAQEAPTVSADITWAAAAGLPAESKVRGGGGCMARKPLAQVLTESPHFTCAVPGVSLNGCGRPWTSHKARYLRHVR